MPPNLTEDEMRAIFERWVYALPVWTSRSIPPKQEEKDFLWAMSRESWQAAYSLGHTTGYARGMEDSKASKES